MLLQGGKHSDLQLWTEWQVEELKMCCQTWRNYSLTQLYMGVLLGSNGFGLCPFFSHILVLLMKKLEHSSWACWLGHRRADIALCDAASNLVGGH